MKTSLHTACVCRVYVWCRTVSASNQAPSWICCDSDLCRVGGDGLGEGRTMAGQPLLFCCGCRCGPALRRCPAATAPASRTPVRAVTEQCRACAPLVGGDRCRFLFLLFLIEFCHRCVRVCDGEKLTVTTAVSRELGLSLSEKGTAVACGGTHPEPTAPHYIFFVHMCKATPCVCPSSAV